MKKILYIAILVCSVFACNSDKSSRPLLPNSTGRSGELVIIIDDYIWDSNVGDTLKYTLAQSQVALPQPEPMFTLVNIPHSAFSNLVKQHRNVLIVNISPDVEQPGITYEENKWANYQLILYFNAPDNESFLKHFNENKTKIVSKILDAECKRTMMVNRKNEESEIRINLEKNHKISLVFPHGYKLDVDSSSFLWVSHTEPEVEQGIFIYYYPYLDVTDLSKENLVSKRNEILRKNVHGSSAGSYMTTEDLVPVYYNSFYRKNKLYIAEMRGLWKLEKGFMGGPFVSHTTIDTVYNRIVTVEGYVFAPNKDKRNLVRQMEAILNSLQITK